MMTVAYIAHPIGGDCEGNLAKVREIVRRVNLEEPDVVPYVPYYADIVSLDDNVLEERNRGIKNDLHLMKLGFIDELRLYGNRISAGMRAEVELAWKLGIEVKSMTAETAVDLAAMKVENVAGTPIDAVALVEATLMRELDRIGKVIKVSFPNDQETYINPVALLSNFRVNTIINDTLFCCADSSHFSIKKDQILLAIEEGSVIKIE